MGGRLGWFPARAIQEMTDDGDSGVFSEYCETLYIHCRYTVDPRTGITSHGRMYLDPMKLFGWEGDRIYVIRHVTGHCTTSNNQSLQRFLFSILKLWKFHLGYANDTNF